MRRNWYESIRVWDDDYGPDEPIPKGFSTWPYRKRVYEDPYYSMLDAADIIKIEPATLRRWIKGHRHNGTITPPIITGEKRNDPYVTWFELVQSDYLNQLHTHGPLRKMRTFLKNLAEKFNEPYPVVNRKIWKPDSYPTIHQIQQQTKLPPHLALVEKTNGDFQLTQPAQQFLDRLYFDNEGLANVLVLEHPTHPKEAPIVARIGQSGAVPIIRDIRTDFISGEQLSFMGEGLTSQQAIQATAEVWDVFDMTPRDVRRAIEFSKLPHLAA